MKDDLLQSFLLQLDLYNRTLGSRLCAKRPPDLTFRLRFCKAVLQRLEAAEVTDPRREVADPRREVTDPRDEVSDPSENSELCCGHDRRVSDPVDVAGEPCDEKVGDLGDEKVGDLGKGKVGDPADVANEPCNEKVGDLGKGKVGDPGDVCGQAVIDAYYEKLGDLLNPSDRQAANFYRTYFLGQRLAYPRSELDTFSTF